MPTSTSHQRFALPVPILRHIVKASSHTIQLKLSATCKFLGYIFHGKFGFHVDCLNIGVYKKFKNRHRLDLVKNLGIALKVPLEDEYIFTKKIRLPKKRKISILNRLFLMRVDGQNYMHSIMKAFDFSSLREVFFIGGNISIKHYKLLMVPTIEKLYSCEVHSADGFDVLEYTLGILPRVKDLKLPWSSELTTFAKLTSIKRSTLLEKLVIFEFPGIDNPSDLATFVNTHIAPNGMLQLMCAKSVSEKTKTDFSDLFEDNGFVSFK